MSSMLGVIRAIRGYLAVAFAIAIAAGLAYSGGTIGVPATYGALILGTVVAGVGYIRWDLRHFPETPAEAQRRRRHAARR